MGSAVRCRLLLICVTVALAGCGGGGQSTLEPHSEPAHAIRTLFWGMTVAAAIVFFGAVGMLGIAALRRHQEGMPLLGSGEMKARGLVVAFGIVIPLVTLVATFVVANFAVAAKTDAPAVGRDPIRIDIVGHQWWWEARYTPSGAVVANELHIPVRTKVEVTVATDDVIHSFWVPELNRKIDLIPGQRNRVELYADRPGTYRGQCAEYCGLQHANMGLLVIAQPAADYRRWVAAQAAPQTSAGPGYATFESVGCGGCHAIRGTQARGRVGPDLTHLASRQTLAALTIPNRRDQLIRWLRDPQGVKFGVRMPAVPMSDRQRAQLADYLESLR
jgi:cytochrome c oxidase subunit 2